MVSSVVSAIGNILIVGANSYCGGCNSGAAYVFGMIKTNDSKH
jgi:hypothetical protein